MRGREPRRGAQLHGGLQGPHPGAAGAPSLLIHVFLPCSFKVAPMQAWVQPCLRSMPKPSVVRSVFDYCLLRLASILCRPAWSGTATTTKTSCWSQTSRRRLPARTQRTTLTVCLLACIHWSHAEHPCSMHAGFGTVLAGATRLLLMSCSLLVCRRQGGGCRREWRSSRAGRAGDGGGGGRAACGDDRQLEAGG
jgi:hypothetical protein